MDWNGMRNSERRIGLGIAPGMLGYRISPRCWTAHGRHWLPSSAQLNIEIRPKLSNTSCSSNGGTGSRKVSVRLSWDMVSSPCLNWKLRSDTERFLSRPIWISTHSTDSGSQIHRKAAGNAFWEPCHADRRSDGIAQSLLESARL